MISARDVISGAADPTRSPYRYIVVGVGGTTQLASIGSGGPALLCDWLFSAVEILEAQGWQLVRMAENMLWVLLRRDVPWAESPPLVP